ncbi:hypothetical protein HGB07_06590 [Candidatus Roizmanbacteria bacterium]|nr:hypothetical protein [Candidatus Roizmanbacteria bacterium]
MKNIGSYRVEIAEIINELFGTVDGIVDFNPEDIIKRSGGCSKKTKYDLAISSSWSAFSKNPSHKSVSCVGLTMQDFLEEYRKGNIVYLEHEHYITFYKNDPIWIAEGYVEQIDSDNKKVILNITDIFDPVSISIQKGMPKWLYDSDGDVYFTCKIYHYWRSLKVSDIEKSDWIKVWKTFKQSFLSQWEIEDKYYDRM